jgi:hypothetical protein
MLVGDFTIQNGKGTTDDALEFAQTKNALEPRYSNRVVRDYPNSRAKIVL